MKTILCNETHPSLMTIARLTNHKITGIRTCAGNVLMCKLDDEVMPVVDAHHEMLRGYGTDFVFVNHVGFEIEL